MKKKILPHVSEYFDPVFFAQMSAQNKLSRSRIIYMHPDDFLALAREGHGDKKESRVENFLEQGKRFPDMPYLWIDTVRKDTKEFKVNYTEDFCQVIAHEGRHRTRALKSLGYSAVPVVINSTSSLGVFWFNSNSRPTSVKSEDGYQTFKFADVFDETYCPVLDKKSGEWV